MARIVCLEKLSNDEDHEEEETNFIFESLFATQPPKRNNDVF